jgi:hypothetical protein
MAQEYNFPVYGTQGGGLVRRSGDHYVFVEVPNWGNFNIGDTMPDEWGIASANQLALSETDPDIDPFDDDYDGDGDDYNRESSIPDAGSHWATPDDAL